VYILPQADKFLPLEFQAVVPLAVKAARRAGTLCVPVATAAALSS